MILPLVLLVALSASRAAQGQSPGQRVDFVTTLGRDTVALERYTRAGTRLDGDIVLRVPGTVHFRYVVDLREDGTIARSVFDVRPLTLPGAAPHTVTLDFTGDSVRVSVDSAGRSRRAVHPAPPGTSVLLTTGFGASFGLYASLGLYQLAIPRLPLTYNDTLLVRSIGAVSGRPATKRFIRRSEALVDVDYFRMAWIHLSLDEAGQIEGADATETTEKTVSRRASGLDIAEAARDFAARDQAGRGIGLASPPDSVVARLGDASVTIDYHSPRRRGREILGAVVPYGKVWRTGADAATVLSTDRPISIGDKVVPAGRYSLWTLPTPEGVDLVINRQYGQWGTEYHPERDLVRVPMKTAWRSVPLENFLIAIVENGETSELRIQWDTFLWSLSIVGK